MHCHYCSRYTPSLPEESKQYNFCPHCGIKLPKKLTSVMIEELKGENIHNLISRIRYIRKIAEDDGITMGLGITIRIIHATIFDITD
jgi:PHP family Zn ribbon phosphoesterase